jgi:hypothetical protein
MLNLLVRSAALCLMLAWADPCHAPVKQHTPVTLSIKRASVYQAVPQQTNSDNLTTASGFKLNPSYAHAEHRILAISRDLLKHLSFGDGVVVIGAGPYDGVWYVHDLMNKRYVSAIDFLTDVGTPNSLHSDVTLIKLDL